MRKITLVLATMLLGVTFATASELVSELNSKDLRITKRYRFTQPIVFVERGVEFLIFQNGEFDFNTDVNYGHFGDSYYRKSRTKRGSINATFGAPGVRINYNRPRGVIITHDRLGRVRRIGNVFINYDYQGRVKRIGSVYMQYRFGQLKQVGGLHIQYNRWGDMIGVRGKVNRSNQGCGFCGMTGCTTDHFHKDNDWYDDDRYDDRWDGRDDDYYYYRKNDKTLKKKKKGVKKRRKY
ncbi:hypothetical protein [Pontimicrobium aquaticum]|uniref:Uncharacterized protein n=1 Tax=Pontimicrobium aquaticum TaxID=2565367 RepID=A0A4U0EQY3_9FLAO|nr:hypothetical protein [Pontimicrobium aquaticum]TJY33958.1 hypothetical protein E5167_11595 [Pontimicrobium aquaticum]